MARSAEPVRRIGVIADDVTGATDVASGLARRGVRTVLLFGVPGPDTPSPDADAFVIALRTRTAPVGLAVSESLAARHWLVASGVERFLFKICSTFDSTPRGNIGPVADALARAEGEQLVIVTPANPENHRTVYQGHLFVGDTLLAESSMRDHPLTPMRDSDLRRLLAAQATGPVGLLPLATVRRGVRAVAATVARHRDQGIRFLVADSTCDADLSVVARATASARVAVTATGLAVACVEPWRRIGVLPGPSETTLSDGVSGPAAVIAGSCSAATLRQVTDAAAVLPTLRVDPVRMAADETAAVASILEWARAHGLDRPVLIAASAPPDEVAAAQAVLGRDVAGALVERVLASVARGLAERGVRRFVVAGGETSGAVLSGLGVAGLRIGSMIEPGVPWTTSLEEPRLALALKSGNFGSPGFFRRALGLP